MTMTAWPTSGGRSHSGGRGHRPDNNFTPARVHAFRLTAKVVPVALATTVREGATAAG